MYCSKCGNKINSDDSFCGSCGSAVNKNNLPKKSIFGRHQQLCFIKNFLGETITGEESELAYKKDSLEYDVIFNELENIKLFIDSNGGLSGSEVAKKVGKDIKALITKGYGICVLQNNPDLKSLCFKVLDDYNGYTLEVAKKQNREEEISNGMQQIKGNLFAIGYLAYLHLGQSDINPSEPFLNTTDYQKAWHIIEAINPINKNDWSLVTSQIVNFCLVKKCEYNDLPTDTKSMLDGIMSYATKFLNEGKINPDEFKVVEDKVEFGKNYSKSQLNK